MSVNVAWKGKRFKTKEYKHYEEDVLWLLPKKEFPEPPLAVNIEYGFSNNSSDIDNPTKPVLDILQKKYNFDDKEIFALNLRKKIVKEGKEYIKIKIEHMKYTDDLDRIQKETIAYLMQACDIKKVTNEFAIAAIVTIVSKETNLKPRTEIGYSKTKTSVIRKVFGSRFKDWTDEQIDKLKASDEKFFNHVYGGRYGNSDPGDGYKFRGRGPNQLTFRANYEARAISTGIDIVSHPELVNAPQEGSLVTVDYFVSKMRTIPKHLHELYGTDINGFKDLNTAVRCIYHANAGWGKSIAAINADPTGGLKKALSRQEDLYQYIKQNGLRK